VALGSRASLLSTFIGKVVGCYYLIRAFCLRGGVTTPGGTSPCTVEGLFLMPEEMLGRKEHSRSWMVSLEAREGAGVFTSLTLSPDMPFPRTVARLHMCLYCRGPRWGKGSEARGGSLVSAFAFVRAPSRTSRGCAFN
jgi:hypothetical protein